MSDRPESSETPTPAKRLCDCWRSRRSGGYCLNWAHWLVTYTTPDDGKTMRTRVSVPRCHWHTDNRFLPVGATQVTTEAIA